VAFYKDTKVGSVAVAQDFSNPIDWHSGIAQHIHCNFDSGFRQPLPVVGVIIFLDHAV
jgi:hypothetical protein